MVNINQTYKKYIIICLIIIFLISILAAVSFAEESRSISQSSNTRSPTIISNTNRVPTSIASAPVPSLTHVSSDCVEDPDLVTYILVLKMIATGVDISNYQNWFNGIEQRKGIDLCEDCVQGNNKELFDVLKKIDENPLLSLSSYQKELYNQLLAMPQNCDDECTSDPRLQLYIGLLQRLDSGSITPDQKLKLREIQLKPPMDICDDCTNDNNKKLFTVLQSINQNPSIPFSSMEQSLYTQLKLMFADCECDEEAWVTFSTLKKLKSLGLPFDESQYNYYTRVPPEPCGECEDLVSKLVAENHELRNQLEGEAHPGTTNRRSIAGRAFGTSFENREPSKIGIWFKKFLGTEE